jgi:hypothetical protein
MRHWHIVFKSVESKFILCNALWPLADLEVSSICVYYQELPLGIQPEAEGLYPKSLYTGQLVGYWEVCDRNIPVQEIVVDSPAGMSPFSIQ